MDAIMSLCKRRGFVFQTSEIYGGINGFWDYGPLGAQLKKNLRDAWWQDVVMNPAWGRKGPNGRPVEMVPVDTCIIQHPKTWEASGHIAGFNDPMCDDKETKQRFRADHLIGAFCRLDDGLGAAISESGVPAFTIVSSTVGEAVSLLTGDKKLRKMMGVGDELEQVGTGEEWKFTYKGKAVIAIFAQVPIDLLKQQTAKVPSPFTGKPGSLTEPRQFNLMFHTFVGANATEDDKAYLRPETAQGIFAQAKNVWDTTRIRVPFGIAQTGKSFRNEVTPRNFTFRSREFEQMEIEFLCHESDALAWYAYWRDWRMEWWKSIGLAGENLILREHAQDELAHYSKATSDIEYRFPFTAPGFGELEGIAYRGNYDLSQHEKFSGVKMSYNDTERGELLPNGQRRGERYIPHVIEPSAGLDRGVLAILCEGYMKDESRPSPEIMKIHPRIAPIKAAIYPLVAKDGMPEVAEKLYEDVRAKFAKIGFIEFDEKQSIGKRYARMDEAGCPYCFTIDGDTLKDQTVTVRERDSGAQQRIGLDKVVTFLDEKLL